MVPIPISFSHLWGDRGDPRGGTPPGYGTNHFVGSNPTLSATYWLLPKHFMVPTDSFYRQ
jgi:hypothetical protein